MNGKLEPLLAKKYKKIKGKESEPDRIDVWLNPDARWSNGKRVRGTDVAYTFRLGEFNKEITLTKAWDYISRIDVHENEQEGEKILFYLHPQRPPETDADEKNSQGNKANETVTSQTYKKKRGPNRHVQSQNGFRFFC